MATGTLLQGTYTVAGRVGGGGMGEVYEAGHARLPGRFAIKVLRQAVSAGSPELAWFRREAEIASSLRHPNIVQVVDFNQTDEGQPYIVMEFLEGHDLASELSLRGRLSLPRVLAIADQVASALAAAHGRGIVHRDLKPQNIFLVPVAGQEKEFIKVVDFGISKVKTLATITGEPQLVGTPQYMAPEQAESRTNEIDGRTDQFALGTIVYELLTGIAPFAADSVPATLYKVAKEDPAPLCSLVPDLPAGVEAVVLRALSKARDGRYLSVLEFSEALAQAAGGLGAAKVSATAPGAALTIAPVRRPTAEGPRAGRRPSRDWVLGVVFVGALTALFIQQRNTRSSAKKAPSAAVVPVTVPVAAAPVVSAPPPAVAPAIAAPWPAGEPPGIVTRQPVAARVSRKKPTKSKGNDESLPPPATITPAPAPPQGQGRGPFIKEL